MTGQPPTLAVSFCNEMSVARHVGVAVSGGSDSLALLYLIAEFARPLDISVSVASVDHRLRPEAAAECAAVARLCAAQRLDHTTLVWEDPDRSGNLQDRARRARYGLLARWAQARALPLVALGHTADDLAETVLMGLARGAGVDGLRGIAPVMTRHDVAFHRPLLHCRRDDLRAYLAARDVAWCDDPSNADDRFERVRAREALRLLAPTGVNVAALCQVAANMTAAAAALETATREVMTAHVLKDRGDLLIGVPFDRVSQEQGRRILLAALRHVSGGNAAPRRAEQVTLLRSLRDGRPATCAGCILTHESSVIRVAREYAAVADLRGPTVDRWDNRWVLSGPHAGDLELRALGDGIADCPGWRDTGLPRASLRATPAVWRGDVLVAAPVAGLSNGWTAQIVADFHDQPFAH